MPTLSSPPIDPTEGRIRALQRIAYGALATEAERARAVAELAALSALEGPAASAELQHPLRPVVESGREADAADVAPAAPPLEPAPSDDTPLRQRGVRWATAAGVAGLLIGVAAGWTAGQRIAADAELVAVAAASSAPDAGTPLEQTDVLPLFDRLPEVAEATRVASVDIAIDAGSVRLLATRTDGPSAYLARTHDGEEVCLVLLMPAGPSRSTCTADGRMPAQGLNIEYDARGYGFAMARLSSTGAVMLGLIKSY